jgi:hypothetical protein
MNSIKAWAIGIVIPMFMGPMVYLIVKYLKQISTWIDSQGATIKRTLVIAVAILVTAGANLLGQPITCDTAAGNAADCLNQLTPDIIKAVLASGIAFFLHYLKQSKPSS